jgi:hypothetical protein
VIVAEEGVAGLDVGEGNGVEDTEDSDDIVLKIWLKFRKGKDIYEHAQCPLPYSGLYRVSFIVGLGSVGLSSPRMER